MKAKGFPLPLSQSCRDVNPNLTEYEMAKRHVDDLYLKLTGGKKRSRTRVGLRCGMNKTEAEFALRLEAMKRSGEILRYEFEGITLRFANVRYTPDFVVIGNEYLINFIEVKGPFIRGNRERAIERYRHAKTYWPEFQFMMWQKKDGSWNQII